jgi:hypothetical protein
MSTVPPLGVLPPPPLLLELLLQAAAPRATTAAMAAIAVVRLMVFPFVDRAEAGQEPRDPGLLAQVRDEGLSAPAAETIAKRRTGRIPGARHGSPCALLPSGGAGDGPC